MYHNAIICKPTSIRISYFPLNFIVHSYIEIINKGNQIIFDMVTTIKVNLYQCKILLDGQ